MPPEESVVLVDGPWRHRSVAAAGLRFHVAECGPEDGPLVLLLHGFPQFWWSWRHQLEALGAAGLRAVAPDLRGYGATDKPPRGYDAYTLSADVAALVRALGAEDAYVAGHDWGGFLAWSVAALHPRAVRGIGVLGATHPVRMRQELLGAGPQALASRYIGLFQLPRLPEARLTRGGMVEQLLRRWAGPDGPDDETVARCTQAMQVPAAAHCALEYYRWAVRSLTRPSGWGYQRLMATGTAVPVLQVHGALDPCILPGTVEGSQAYATGGYDLHLLDGVGHFVQEEAPAAVTDLLLARAGA